MSAEQYTNDGQQRILRLINVLAGHEVTGLAPSQIAQQQSCSASLVTRDLANLQMAGFAEQVPDSNCWRLAPQVVQISIRHATALQRAEARLAEVTQRFSRS
ncbi:MAG: IclR family transcriptional regulator [Ramlibacter sp.]